MDVFLVGADQELAWPQPLAVEHAGVQVQRDGCFGREVRVAGEDPGAMEPRARASLRGTRNTVAAELAATTVRDLYNTPVPSA